MRSIRVVAAVVQRGGRILVARRHREAERGGLWEFPGGKVEAGEAEPDALRREIAEELGCGIEVSRLLLRHRHCYPDLEVELAFYEAALAPGSEPRHLGVDAIEWAEPHALADYEFCEADRPVLGIIAGMTHRASRLD